MTTTTVPAKPDPAFVAAIPTIRAAIADFRTAITTILTGDMALAPARVGPAVGILVNQLALLAPGLLSSEQGALLQDATSGLDGLDAKLAAIQAQAAATPPAAAAAG